MSGSVNPATTSATSSNESRAANSMHWLRSNESDSRESQMDENTKLYEKTLNDFEQRLQHFEKSPDPVRDLIDIPHRRIESLRFATQLSQLGHAREAEQLMLKALDTVQHAYGEKSVVAADQLSQLMNFYLLQNRDDDAQKTLKRLLQFNLRTIEIGRPSPLVQIYQSAVRLSAENRVLLGFSLLNMLLEEQRKTFEPDDKRIAATLVAFADVEEQQHEYKKEEAYLLEAAAIYRLYSGIEGLTNYYPLDDLGFRDLPRLWIKMGEHEKGKLYGQRLSPTLLRHFGKIKAAEELEKTGELKSALRDISPQEFPAVDDKADAKIKMQWLQANYKKWQKEEPYSQGTWKILEQIAVLSKAEGQWQQLAESGSALVKIEEHWPASGAGRRQGCILTSESRLDCYDYAVTGYVQLRRFKEAQNFVDRALTNNAELTCYEYIKIADLEIDCQNIPAANKYAELAEAMFDEESMWHAPKLVAVWNRLGNTKRSRDLEDKLQEFRVVMQNFSAKKIDYATMRSICSPPGGFIHPQK